MTNSPHPNELESVLIVTEKFNDDGLAGISPRTDAKVSIAAREPWA